MCLNCSFYVRELFGSISYFQETWHHHENSQMEGKKDLLSFYFCWVSFPKLALKSNATQSTVQYLSVHQYLLLHSKQENIRFLSLDAVIHQVNHHCPIQLTMVRIEGWNNINHSSLTSQIQAALLTNLNWKYKQAVCTCMNYKTYLTGINAVIGAVRGSDMSSAWSLFKNLCSSSFWKLI